MLMVLRYPQGLLVHVPVCVIVSGLTVEILWYLTQISSGISRKHIQIRLVEFHGKNHTNEYRRHKGWGFNPNWPTP